MKEIILHGKHIFYEILEDGYKIAIDNSIFISQLEPYGHPMDSTKSYEENCMLQIEEITKPQEQVDSTEERLSNLEDYTSELLYQICLLKLGIEDEDME